MRASQAWDLPQAMTIARTWEETADTFSFELDATDVGFDFAPGQFNMLYAFGAGEVPISISGWGLRELAVISLLGNHGVPPERALLFSVCFGLVLAVGSLPGALAWLLYSFAPSWRSAERGG